MPASLSSLAAVLIGFAALPTHADETWKSGKGGNIRMEGGDTSINYGSTTPWYVFQQIKEHCSSIGCHGDNILEIETDLVGGSNPVHFDGTIAVSIEGTFMKEGELGSLENLVDLATELVAIRDSYDVKTKHYNEGTCIGSAGSNIDPCSSMKTHYIDQYQQTNAVYVRLEDEDGGVMANLHVHVTVTRNEDDSSGWCETLATIGGAVAGAVDKTGVAGGAFSLASLGCVLFE